MGRFEFQGEQDVAGSPSPRVVGGSPGFMAAGNQAVARAAAQPGMMVRLLSLGSIVDTAVGVAGEVGQGLLGQELRASVGADGANLPGDVMIVMRLLEQAGFGGGDVNAGILRFQKEALNWAQPDGRIDPHGKTFTALVHHHAAAAAAGPAAAGPAPTAAPAAPVATGGAVAATPAAIEAELDKLAALQQKALKAGSDFEEGGPNRAALVAGIGEVRKAIAGVTDPDKKAEYFHRVNAIAPFYTQAENKNIIGRAVATTCNLTTVAMGLELLGKSPSDYLGNWDTMHAVEAWANRDLKNAGIDFESSRFADFMELVAVVQHLGNAVNPSDEQINAARMQALQGPNKVSAGVAPLRALYAAFGVTTRVVTSPSSVALEALGEKKFRGVWGTDDARQKAERKGQSGDAEVAAAGRNMSGLASDEAAIPLEGYKEWAMTTFGPILDAGLAVSVGQFNHWMRLQAINDEFVTVDDPSGGSRVNRKQAWEEARAEGLFWQSVVAGG